MPMQPTCTKTNGAGSAGRVESEPPHVGWRGLAGKGSSARAPIARPAGRADLPNAHCCLQHALLSIDSSTLPMIFRMRPSRPTSVLEAVNACRCMKLARTMSIVGPVRFAAIIASRMGLKTALETGQSRRTSLAPFSIVYPCQRRCDPGRARIDRIGTARRGGSAHVSSVQQEVERDDQVLLLSHERHPII